MRTLRFLLRKEFKQIFCDRAMLVQIIMVPFIQLLVLANAATFEVKSSRLFVVDDDHSATSRALVQRLGASGRFTVVAASQSMTLADESLLDRSADVILHVPHDFERDLVRTRASSVALVLDAENGAAAGVAQAYAAQTIAAFSQDLGAQIAPTSVELSSSGEAPPRRGAGIIDVRARGWYNPDLNYKIYMVPGLLVALVTIVGTLVCAVNIVREKELGTLDQLNVAPLSRGTFIAGKLIPCWSIALGELTIGLLVARFVFGVPMRGSILLVFVVASVYLVAALGIGLWVSTIAATQQQAMFVTFFLVMVYLLMSGLFTPVHSMPTWAQWLAQFNPVMHFTSVMRAVLLKGATAADVARPVLILAAYGTVVLSLAVRQYTKRAA
jgi:ABC-2 type transport system permease protein